MKFGIKEKLRPTLFAADSAVPRGKRRDLPIFALVKAALRAKTPGWWCTRYAAYLFQTWRTYQLFGDKTYRVKRTTLIELPGQ